MEKFRIWYTNNYLAISWFIIGFLVAAGLDDLSRENYSGAVISFVIALINYLFVKNENRS